LHNTLNYDTLCTRLYSKTVCTRLYFNTSSVQDCILILFLYKIVF
jgi:hypothetical protein